MDIKYFVRTTGSRQFDYHYELPEYYSIYDREYLGVQKYINDMFIYGKFNSAVMEDDNYTKLKNIFFKYRGKSHEEFEKNIGNKVAMSKNHEFIVRKCLLLADEHAMFLQEGEKENE